MFEQLRPLVVGTALKVEDIVGKAASGHVPPPAQAIVSLLLLSRLGNDGMG